MAKRKLAAELNTALDLAAALARGGKPQEGVNGVIALLNASTSSVEERNIMDGATERGFVCQYYPVNGQMGIRVQYTPSKKGA